MFTIAVLHHKEMKLCKLFTPLVIAWRDKKRFDQSMRGTKGQKARLQCLASEMPKSVMPSRVTKSAKLLRTKIARIWHMLNSEFFVSILRHIWDGNKRLQKW